MHRSRQWPPFRQALPAWLDRARLHLHLRRAEQRQTGLPIELVPFQPDVSMPGGFSRCGPEAQGDAALESLQVFAIEA